MTGLLEKIGVKGKKGKAVDLVKEEKDEKAEKKELQLLTSKKKQKPKKETGSKKSGQKAKAENAYQVLLGFLETEKSSRDAKLGKYYFKVNPKSGKRTIKRAVEEYYGVAVTGVNIMNCKPKEKRYRLIKGTRSIYKKAVVTLKEGDSIK